MRCLYLQRINGEDKQLSESKIKLDNIITIVYSWLKGGLDMFKIRENGVEPTPMKYVARIADEAIIDAETIKDIVACIVGPEYYDCEDNLDDWNMRLRAARNLAMQMLQFDKEVVVVSDGQLIPDNMGTNLDDPDYAMDHEVDFQIDIASELSFLESLKEMDMINYKEN